jgi:hypothetical protein
MEAPALATNLMLCSHFPPYIYIQHLCFVMQLVFCIAIDLCFLPMLIFALFPIFQSLMLLSAFQSLLLVVILLLVFGDFLT